MTRLVGLVPSYPWPFSAWTWWTRPVRAERLALLRIGIAFCLLLDIFWNYLFHLDDFFGANHLGAPGIHGWYLESPSMRWSLLRGVGNSTLSFLSLSLLICSTLWILTHFLRAFTSPMLHSPHYSLFLWGTSALMYCAGVWARILDRKEASELVWIVPAAIAGCALLFLILEAIRRQRHDCFLDCQRYARLLYLFLGLTVLLVVAGISLRAADSIEPNGLPWRLLHPWQNDPHLLGLAFGIWMASTVCLLLGIGTHVAALITWSLALSFSNLNPTIDNAGDTIRNIILFYLVLTPAGAVWSLDHRWLAPRSVEELYISPWPIRLLFVQLVFIYFCNGFFKVIGNSWLEGESLRNALGDLTLTRFSFDSIPISTTWMRLSTWFVLAWEVGFPLYVLWRPTRILALTIGVLFHLGILATMELGMFVPYILCIYLPMLPWKGELVERTS